MQNQRLLESRSFLCKGHKGYAGNGILEANFVYISYALKADYVTVSFSSFNCLVFSHFNPVFCINVGMTSGVLN